MSRREEVAPGVIVFRSSVYSMASGLVLPRPGKARAGAPALLVDPGVLPSEVMAISEELQRAGARAALLLLTHSDWDHVSGASQFPGARVICSSAYPARVSASRREIEEEIESFATAFPSRPRPRVVIPEAGTLVGSESLILDSPRTARAVPSPGHTSDGLALLLPDEGVLFAGDYLCALEIPFVESSFPEFRRTLARFRRLLMEGAVHKVVPGHGPWLDAAAARDVLEQDDRYLASLETAVGKVLELGGTGEEALGAAAGVAVHRGAQDADIVRGHRRNCALAVRELAAGGV